MNCPYGRSECIDALDSCETCLTYKAFIESERRGKELDTLIHEMEYFVKNELPQLKKRTMVFIKMAKKAKKDW